jgi:hypothetical protein
MMNREKSAITFLHSHNFTNIPIIVESKPEFSLNIFEWINGAHPEQNSKTIDHLIEMCTKLNFLNQKQSYVYNAVDCAYSTSEIYDQLSFRLNSLISHERSGVVEMLRRKFELRLEEYDSKYRTPYNFSGETLSISDLGSHNMLKDKKRCTFIDFEFFGRDSIEKMVGDFLLHPRNDFNKGNILRFLNKISSNFKWDFRSLIPLLPLLSLKWSLIAFNRSLRNGIIVEDRPGIQLKLEKSLSIKYLNFFDFLLEHKFNENIPTFSIYNAKIQKYAN